MNAPLPTAVRMNVDEIPLAYRAKFMPTAQPSVRDGKLVHFATVFRWGEGAQAGTAVLLWSDIHTVYRDRDEALEVAALAADRLATADFCGSRGQVLIA